MVTNYRYFSVVCVMLLSLQSTLGFSEESAHSTATSVEVFAKSRGFSIVKSFPTDAAAMTGYVLKNQQGNYGIVYSVDDLIIAGQIVDKDGNDLAAKYASANIPKPDYAAAVKTLEADRTLVIDGKKSAPVIYVIADPNCIFCHKFFTETRTWVAQGKVQLRWVMVGFLKPSSPGRAAAIMAAKDRAKANTENQTTFAEKTEEGAISELKPVPAELQQALKQHEKVMSDLHFEGTPGLIYKNKEGQWQGVAGALPLEQLAQQMGIKN